MKELHPVGKGNRLTEFHNGMMIDDKSGAVISKGDSLYGKGRFTTLKNGSRVFLKNTLPVQRQKLAISLVNQDLPDDKKINISGIKRMGSAYSLLTEKQVQELYSKSKMIVDGKTAKRIILKQEKKYGEIPAFNVATSFEEEK